MHFVHCSEKAMKEDKAKEAQTSEASSKKVNKDTIRRGYHVVDPDAYWGLSSS